MGEKQRMMTDTRKKIVKGAFWTAFAGSLVFSSVAYTKVQLAEAKPMAMPAVTADYQKYVNTSGAEGFALQFVREYTTWELSDDGKRKRSERLAQYLGRGLDEQAGMTFEGMEWNSRYTFSQVWKVEGTGKNSFVITVRVRHQLYKMVQTDPAQPPVEQKGKELEKWLAIPVTTDGNGYIVTGIPSLVAKPEKPNVSIETTKTDGAVTDSKVRNGITTFLETFFQAYTTGSEKELARYAKVSIQPLAGVAFQEIRDVVIVKQKDGYNVTVTVLLQDNESKAITKQTFHITVQQEKDNGGWWIVKW